VLQCGTFPLKFFLYDHAFVPVDLARQAVCCSVLQCVACVICACLLGASDSVLKYVAVCCSVLQCVAVCCSKMQRVAVCYSVLQCVAARCSVLLCVAACCSALQRVAACCCVWWCSVKTLLFRPHLCACSLEYIKMFVYIYTSLSLSFFLFICKMHIHLYTLFSVECLSNHNFAPCSLSEGLAAL